MLLIPGIFASFLEVNDLGSFSATVLRVCLPHTRDFIGRNKSDRLTNTQTSDCCWKCRNRLRSQTSCLWVTEALWKWSGHRQPGCSLRFITNRDTAKERRKQKRTRVKVTYRRKRWWMDEESRVLLVWRAELRSHSPRPPIMDQHLMDAEPGLPSATDQSSIIRLSGVSQEWSTLRSGGEQRAVRRTEGWAAPLRMRPTQTTQKEGAGLEVDPIKIKESQLDGLPEQMYPIAACYPSVFVCSSFSCCGTRIPVQCHKVGTHLSES